MTDDELNEIERNAMNDDVYTDDTLRLIAEVRAARAELNAMQDRVVAFAGQLQAMGVDEAARQVLREIIGGTVDASDYYALRKEVELLRPAGRAVLAYNECDIAGDIVEDVAAALIAAGWSGE